MYIPNVFKRALLLGCLSVLSLQTLAHENKIKDENTDKTISQLYHSLNSKPKSDMATRLQIISAEFLGKPYLLGPLGEGIQGEFDQSPLQRTDAFDCETLVDTVVALALADDPHQFKYCINQIRYRNGRVSFIDRNHFTCLDWNKNNQHKGFVKDITTTVIDNHHQPVAKFAHALINKPGWYNHFSTDSIRLQRPDPIEQTKRLSSLKQRGSQLPAGISTLPYVPLSILFDSTGKPNTYLFKQIPNGAIIEIVRPNWDLTKEIGTHLNVSHLGFAFWENGNLIFREASSEYHRVVDVSLIDYLHDALKSPTIKGINIQIVQPKQDSISGCGAKRLH